MKQPLEPSKEDCCNSGCNPCIFDVYERQLILYKKLEKQNLLSTQISNGISQLEYTRFLVSNTTNVCESHKLISFKRLETKEESVSTVWWNPGDHFLLKYCSNGTSCTRAYTPIKLKSDSSEKYDFSIILKWSSLGLVSKYLSELKEGEETLWRGPYGSYTIIPNKYKRIIMLAQGTGIAPLISIIDSILDNENDMTSIHLFFCCPSEDLILFRDVLYNFKSFWNFTYKIFLNISKDPENRKYQEPVINQKLNNKDFIHLKPFTNDDQFLICGSTIFMKDYESYFLSEGVLNENIVLF